jgi:hypothetical protein
VHRAVTEILPQTLTTKPSTNGDEPLPKRNPPKPMIPTSWLQRGMRIEYVDSNGRGVATTVKLLDTYPAGLILAVDGCRMLLSWERLVLAELVEN